MDERVKGKCGKWGVSTVKWGKCAEKKKKKKKMAAQPLWAAQPELEQLVRMLVDAGRVYAHA